MGAAWIGGSRPHSRRDVALPAERDRGAGHSDTAAAARRGVNDMRRTPDSLAAEGVRLKGASPDAGYPTQLTGTTAAPATSGTGRTLVIHPRRHSAHDLPARPAASGATKTPHLDAN